MAFGNLVETFERIHAEYWRLYLMAEAAGDVKLAHSILNDMRKLVEMLVRYAPKMKGANVQDLVGHDEEAERRLYEQARVALVDRLETLLGRHQANVVRGDEHLNSDEVRASGRTVEMVNESAQASAAQRMVDEDDDELDAGDEAETLEEVPPRPASSPTDKGLGPLTGFEKAEWDV